MIATINPRQYSVTTVRLSLWSLRLGTKLMSRAMIPSCVTTDEALSLIIRATIWKAGCACLQKRGTRFLGVISCDSAFYGGVVCCIKGIHAVGHCSCDNGSDGRLSKNSRYSVLHDICELHERPKYMKDFGRIML